MQWNSSYQESIHSFANNINTREGGSHLSGFRSALTRTLNKYARDHSLLKEKEDNLSGEDVREGLTAVISVKLRDPQFEGQTKTKLGNPGMAGLRGVDRQHRPGRVPGGEPERGARGDHEVRPGAARPRGRAQGPRPDAAQVGARRTRRCRASSPTARSRTRRWPSCSSSRATPPAARPSRVATATRRRCCRCAARSSTSRRARIDKVLQNTEIQALITAIGTGVRDEFNIENARYHKVVLMTDADVDGAHIRTLVLTLLFREMQELIEAGYVYIAKPPLYKLKQGSRERYIEKDSELEEILLSDKWEKIDDLRPPRHAVQADRGPLAALHAAAQAVRGLGLVAARRARPRRRAVPGGVLAAGRAGDERRGARSSCSRRAGVEGETHATESGRAGPDGDPREGRRGRRPASRARTASSARCSTRRSTASWRACTRS